MSIKKTQIITAIPANIISSSCQHFKEQPVGVFVECFVEITQHFFFLCFFVCLFAHRLIKHVAHSHTALY